MSVLITGGAGYIGSHTARLLAESGQQVWVYDNLSTGHRAAAPQGTLIEGDLHQQQRLADVMRDKQVAAVIHFAASSLVNESVNDPGKYYRNNVAGSHALLEAMREAGVRKIVFSSTTATYGEPAHVPISEDEAQQPINPYGFTKLVIEQMLRDYADAYQFRYAALRYFNAAGAAADGKIGEDHRPESHLIPIVLQVALGQRGSVTIFGDDYPTPDGTCIRDYIHVDDLATAHRAALARLDDVERLELNLGTGRGASVLEIVEACRRVTGREIPAEKGARRAGDPPELVADPRRAQQQLDWSCRYTTVESIIETAWEWHRRHPQGYE